MGFLPTAYALIVAGLDLAVAALCWGWPRGELWPVETRWAGWAMLIASLTTISAAMLMAGIAPDLALRGFIAGAIGSFVAGTSAAIPSDAPRAAKKRSWVALAAIPAIALVVLTAETVVSAGATARTPHRVLTLRTAAVFAVVCGSLQIVQAF